MAASDKRELILDLLARDKTGQGTGSAARNLKGVGDEADKTGRKLGLFGRESKKAEDAADDLGDEASDVAKQLGKLDAQIELAKHELGGLARAFADTDDAAQRLDISKVQRKLNADISRLTKNKAILKGLIPEPEEKDFRSLGNKLTTGLKGAWERAGGALKGAGAIAGIAALGPELGGLVAAGIVGGVGLGGIIGGVALTAKNPQIAAYGKQIGSTFMKDVGAEAEGAFLNPVQKSLGQLDVAAQQSVGKIGKIFQNLAPELEPLTKNLIGAGNALLDSFVYASAKAGPVIRAFGRLAEGVGKDVGGLIEEMADHSDVAADAVDHLTDTIHVLTSALGPAIGALSEGYVALKKITDWADGVPVLGDALDALKTALLGPLGLFGEFAEKVGLSKKATEEAVPPTKELTGEQKALQQSFDDATRAALGEQSALDELSKQLKAQTDPVFGLLTAQDKLAEAQKNVAEATKKHGSKSKEAEQALRDLAEAALDVEGAAGALGDEFNGQMTPALEATLRSAGLTTSQINKLKGQFREAKGAGEAFAKNYRANLQVTGTQESAARVQHVRDLLAQVRSKKISVNVLINDGRLDKVNNQLDRLGARATGGSVLKGVPYTVGEGGKEVFVPESNGRVMSASASRGMRAAPSGVAGGGGGTLQLEVVGQQEIVTFFRYLIRSANLIQ